MDEWGGSNSKQAPDLDLMIGLSFGVRFGFGLPLYISALLARAIRKRNPIENGAAGLAASKERVDTHVRW